LFACKCLWANHFRYLKADGQPRNIDERFVGRLSTMKIKLDRIISIATLGSSVVALVLVLQKPHPIAKPQPPAAIAANAESLQTKIQELMQPKGPGQAPVQVRLTSEEVGAALAQATGAMMGAQAASASQGGTVNMPTSVPSSADAAFAPGDADIKDYQVNFDGDVARGQFVAQVGGKTVYVTLAGHLGAKDGFATFEPTEFKVGDLSIPVSLVNDALQKKLLEQRDRLKLPDGVDDMHVENGQLVMTGK
jgi:hypothetical protein